MVETFFNTLKSDLIWQTVFVFRADVTTLLDAAETDSLT